MEKHHHQKNLPRDKQKKPLFFPCFLATPQKSGTDFEDNFSAANKTKNPPNKMAKNRAQKSENAIFPLIFDACKRKS